MQLWLKRLFLVGIVLAGIVLLINYERLLHFVGSVDQMRAWLVALGPLGPLGLIFLNAIQVVVAPVPGYVMQVLAGYLFGWFPGTIIGVIGMALGGALAMGLSRVYGRPLVHRMVGSERMGRWEKVTRLNSLLLWTILLLGPLGDAPFYVAGLTRLAIWQVVLAATIVRIPTVMVSAAVGAGILSWRSPWVIAGAIVLVILGILAVRYQEPLQAWTESKMLNKVLAMDADRGMDNPAEQAKPGKG